MSSTLIHSFNRDTTYPVYVSVTATHRCGTVSIQLPDEFTEQMSYELPSINIDVYTSLNDTLVLYRERALVVPVDMQHKDSTYSILDIPKQCIFAITPLYDDSAVKSHNNMAEVFEESEWTTRTLEFPLTLTWSDVNVVAGGSNGGGTTDYSELENKPQINNVELDGNKTSSDLGLQPTIDSSNKLSADLVDDTNTTHKFNVQANWTEVSSSAASFIQNKPTLGTSSALDVPVSGDATTSQVVKGDDSRLTDSRTPTAHNQASSTITTMSGYTEDSPTTADSILTSDSLNDAIRKLETGVETNKTNITTEQSKTVGMTAGGSNYITVGGIRVYVSATSPTGNIPDGSVGVGW